MLWRQPSLFLLLELLCAIAQLSASFLFIEPTSKVDNNSGTGESKKTPAERGKDNLIVSLPGLTQMPTDFRQYSGYLKATGTRRLFYWFVESSRDPKNDPLVLWLNGGPGCSSVDGLLSEHGPFKVNDDGATLETNDYSWNQVANMLYVEAPVGVGFSYSGDDNYTNSDDQTSLDNYVAMKSFFLLHPRFAKNRFFIAGESYGGIYVPTLAVRVLKDRTINFQGFLIGNSYSDKKLNDMSTMYFAYFHGLIDSKLWRSLVRECCLYGNSELGNCNFDYSNNSESCIPLVDEAYKTFGNINWYNIHKECYKPPLASDTQRQRRSISQREMLVNGLKGTYPCLNTTAETVYLNSPRVQKALHVNEGFREWQVCSNSILGRYIRQYDSMREQYLEILSTNKVRALLYNGDFDTVCNFLSDQWFAESLNQPVIRAWAPWHYEGSYGSSQIAGFAVHYENLIFATVKGAGHSTPIDKPEESFELFSRFLDNTF